MLHRVRGRRSVRYGGQHAAAAGAKKKQRVEPAITEWLESSDDARGASRGERRGASEEGEEDGAESSEPPSDFLVAPDADQHRGVPAGRRKKGRTPAEPRVAAEGEGREAAGESGESHEEIAAALRRCVWEVAGRLQRRPCGAEHAAFGS